jgi:tetratricopeptide (TPR) repeat protein
MGALGRERSDPALELLALIGQAVLRAIPNPLFDLTQGQALCGQAMRLAQELDDGAAQSKILWVLMMGEVFAVGDAERAVHYGEQSLVLARRLNLREQAAYTLNDLFRAYTFGGQLAEAQQALEQARLLWEEAQNLPLLADTLANFSRIHFFQGHFAQAILYSDEAFDLCQRAHNFSGQVNSRFSVGGAYFETGAIGKGVEVLSEALQMGRQFQHVSARSYLPAELAWAYTLMGDFERGIALAREACAIGRQIFLLRAYARIVLARVLIRHGPGELAEAEAALNDTGLRGQWKFSLPHVPLVAALAEVELAVARGQLALAQDWLDQLTAHLQKVPIRPYVPEALYWQGRLCLLQPQPDLERAFTYLTQARAEAAAIGSRRLLWPILAELAQLARRRHHDDTASALREEARAIIAFIAEHCPTDRSSTSGHSLRESFLNLPEVKRVMYED